MFHYVIKLFATKWYESCVIDELEKDQNKKSWLILGSLPPVNEENHDKSHSG
jgi:hypothetical protein